MTQPPERQPVGDIGASVAGSHAMLAQSRNPLHGAGVLVAAFCALALPISTAATSVGKVLILLCTLAILLTKPASHTGDRLRLASIAVALALFGLLALSLLWTVADPDSALNDLVKYGKLVLIPALIVLLPTRRDAVVALACWGAAQAFVVVSSVLLGLGVDLPWIGDDHRLSPGSVFSDYITQSIMTATFAALCWVLRDHVPGRHGRAVAIGIGIVAFANTLYFLPGRTGWIIAAVLVTLIAWWELPRRLRAVAVVVPVCVAGLLLSSDTGRTRFNQVIAETGEFMQRGVENSSSGERLNFWRRSIQSMAADPWLGSGVGSWQLRYHQLEDGSPPENTRTTRNPHNEYLLLGVQTGAAGMLLFVGFLAALCHDAFRFDRATARAIVLVTASLAVGSLFNSALFDVGKGNFFCIVAGLLFAFGAGAGSDAKRELNGEN